MTTNTLQSNRLLNVSLASSHDLRRRIETELTGNILPFWIMHAIDTENGGFYGALSNDLRALNDVPRSAVLCTRILWTYSAAYRRYERPEFLYMARRAYEYLCKRFWDSRHGGVFWTIDARGRPLSAHKLSYAQAFAIHGLAEFYRATQDPHSLHMAQDLFGLLDQHAHDPVNGGYVESRSSDWALPDDTQPCDQPPGSRKSMNTMLLIMESYTNLLRLHYDERVRARLLETVRLFLRHVIDPQMHHFRLFFDDRWNASQDVISYGHDIAGSWLLVEAAELLADADLLAQARAAALALAQVTYAEARDADGSLVYQGRPGGWIDTDRHWWVQTEGLVGFYNAYQLSGQAHFIAAAHECWNVIEAKFVDRRHGEWFKVLDRAGVPSPYRYKAGPWECPYHHSRACLELIERLAN